MNLFDIFDLSDIENLSHTVNLSNIISLSDIINLSNIMNILVVPEKMHFFWDTQFNEHIVYTMKTNQVNHLGPRLDF